jgi:hypothetical protein
MGSGVDLILRSIDKAGDGLRRIHLDGQRVQHSRIAKPMIE